MGFHLFSVQCDVAIEAYLVPSHSHVECFAKLGAQLCEFMVTKRLLHFFGMSKQPMAPRSRGKLLLQDPLRPEPAPCRKPESECLDKEICQE